MLSSCVLTCNGNSFESREYCLSDVNKKPLYLIAMKIMTNARLSLTMCVESNLVVYVVVFLYLVCSDQLRVFH